MAKTSQQQCSSTFLPKRMACHYLLRNLRKPFWNQDSSTHAMGTTNSSGRFPRSPFQPRSKIRSWRVLIVWSLPKPSHNMRPSSGVNLHMICSRQSHNLAKPLYSVSWDGWSKRRLCTNEVCHHRQPIPLSMHSFEMLRTNPY